MSEVPKFDTYSDAEVLEYLDFLIIEVIQTLTRRRSMKSNIDFLNAAKWYIAKAYVQQSQREGMHALESSS